MNRFAQWEICRVVFSKCKGSKCSKGYVVMKRDDNLGYLWRTNLFWFESLIIKLGRDDWPALLSKNNSDEIDIYCEISFWFKHGLVSMKRTARENEKFSRFYYINYHVNNVYSFRVIITGFLLPLRSYLY